MQIAAAILVSFISNKLIQMTSSKCSIELSAEHIFIFVSLKNFTKKQYRYFFCSNSQFPQSFGVNSASDGTSDTIEVDLFDQ